MPILTLVQISTLELTHTLVQTRIALALVSKTHIHGGLNKHIQGYLHLKSAIPCIARKCWQITLRSIV